MAGRKGYGEEIRITQRYSSLTEPAFKFILECLEGTDKADKKWAVEQLNKGFQKMIPQDITSGGEKIEVLPLLGGQSNGDTNNNSNQETTETQEEN